MDDAGAEVLEEDKWLMVAVILLRGPPLVIWWSAAAPRISTAAILFDELVKDREKVRHRLTLTRLAVLDPAEGDSRLRHLTRLMDKLREAPPAQTTRPPQPNRCVDRGFDIVVTEIDSRQSNAILDLDLEAGPALCLPTAHRGATCTRGRAEPLPSRSLPSAFGTRTTETILSALASCSCWS
jgi:hypothetical protein